MINQHYDFEDAADDAAEIAEIECVFLAAESEEARVARNCRAFAERHKNHFALLAA